MALSILQLLLALSLTANAIAIGPSNLPHTAHLVPELVDHDLQYPVNGSISARDDMKNCTIRSYSDNACQNQIWAYDYGVVEGDCRNCRHFDESHSYKLEGYCWDAVTVWAYDHDCGQSPASGAEMILYMGPPPYGACQVVNTKHNWQTGRLCYPYTRHPDARRMVVA